jgi:hypothetical protein
MSNSTGIGGKSLNELSPEEKGKLLASIKTHRKERPLDPITVAEILGRTPSNAELARKLGITPRMVVMFKSLLSLPQDIQPYVKWTGGISFDKAQRIASLRDIVCQQFLSKAIVAEPNAFTAPTVAKIVALKNNNKNMPIEDCVQRVLKSRPIVENRYIFVTGIEKSLSEAVSNRAAEQGISSVDLLKGILRQSLPSDESLLSAVTHDGSILLTLTVDGWQALRQKSGILGVPLDELVETLVTLSFETGTSK